MDAEAAARRWVEGWSAGWAAADPDRIAALYAEDAVFVSQPFREPHLRRPGVREYARWAFADEETLDFSFGEPRVGRDGAAVEYWALLRSDGRERTLAGVALIRFGEDGLVAKQRDYWSIEDEWRERPPGWGR